MTSHTPSATASRFPSVFRTALLLILLLFAGYSLYLCHRALAILERTVTVIENIDAKLDRAATVVPSALEKVDAKLDRALATVPAAINKVDAKLDRALDHSKELLQSSNSEQLRDLAKEKAANLAQKLKNELNRKPAPPNPENQQPTTEN